MLCFSDRLPLIRSVTDDFSASGVPAVTAFAEAASLSTSSLFAPTGVAQTPLRAETILDSATSAAGGGGGGADSLASAAGDFDATALRFVAADACLRLGDWFVTLRHFASRPGGIIRQEAEPDAAGAISAPRDDGLLPVDRIEDSLRERVGDIPLCVYPELIYLGGVGPGGAYGRPPFSQKPPGVASAPGTAPGTGLGATTDNVGIAAEALGGSVDDIDSTIPAVQDRVSAAHALRVAADSDNARIVSHSRVLEWALAATRLTPEWPRAWQSGARVSANLAGHFASRLRAARLAGHDPAKEVRLRRLLGLHVSASLGGFFRSLVLSGPGRDNLSVTLRLLTVWFRYGGLREAEDVVSRGIEHVSPDCWLHVVPQVIARLHSPCVAVRHLVHRILATLGAAHPQSLVNPLTVAATSETSNRQADAMALLDSLKRRSRLLVEQSLVVTRELIRIAILWPEMWHDGLEEASRQFFTAKSAERMFEVVQPLHQMLEQGCATLSEASFRQSYGASLSEAFEWCKRFTHSCDLADVNQAWSLYYAVFKSIAKAIQQVRVLDLQFVSPRLLHARDLELSVPAAYNPRARDQLVTISHFAPQLNVIQSKQRPRKMTLFGSDGRKYAYLLKGNEDIRQDERVMQLFGLVNTLLAADGETGQKDLSIQRYAAIPLSPNSGLLSWVPQTDTLHALVKAHRDERGVLMNVELRLMLQLTPEYDTVTLIGKIEAFDYALENTRGADLHNVLWQRSRSSEVWLSRRTNYTRSLAVMSMVGYILGLGDRHPSNIMLKRSTGKVLHIDYGDAFEAARLRPRYPERIPFRLTRMLIKAMEVSGVEGNFRLTSESTLRVLRTHKDSLIAILTAFVYDPLQPWRLARPNPPAAGDPAPAPNPIAEAAGVDPLHAADPHLASLQTRHRQTPSAVEQALFLMDGVDDGAGEDSDAAAANQQAVTILNTVRAKLTGNDFPCTPGSLPVSTQVALLIDQARSKENLCQCYSGWVAVW
jgi:FKBP12-rapamycin complex-associated protein